METLVIFMESEGIGDAILCSAVASGMKKLHPNSKIYYRVQPHLAPWFAMYKDVDMIYQEIDGVTEYLPYSIYGKEIEEKGRDLRVNYYASVCDNVKPVKPTWVVPEDQIKWAEEWKDHIILCPFSYWGNRNYPVQYWKTLENLLFQKGEKVLILDSPGDGERTLIFDSFRFWGIEVAQVAALIKVAKCVIANDSGMAHLAGALNTKAIALCGPSEGTSIFGFWNSVKPINGKLHCNACYWHGEYYYDSCVHFCINLASILPQELIQIEFKPKPKLF